MKLAFIIFTIAVAWVCSGWAAEPGATSNDDLIITPEGGSAFLGPNGSVFIYLKYKINAANVSRSIQPWWYGSYEVDRKAGNLLVAPLAETMLPSPTDPIMKSLVVSNDPVVVDVKLASLQRGLDIKLKDQAVATNSVSIRLRYNDGKGIRSNWASFEIVLGRQ
jgi:hypothetical protein